MSFPTLQVRPNEKNPKILRAHEFLRQSNQLVERNLINNDGKKMLARMLSKMVAEAKGIYALDEKRTDSRKNVKLMEQLKTAHQTSVSVLEDRFVNADLAKQVFEKKLDVQKKYSEIEYLRKSVQEKKLEVQRENEKQEQNMAAMAKTNEEFVARSSTILKHLENSADVAKLRKMEEENREMEAVVEALREQKQALADEIKTKRATLKAESKKPFKKMVIECAKHYKLCQSLTPKLLNSQKNVELLKEEEEARRASGSLDETIPFDRSFVLASMERDTPVNLRSPPPAAHRQVFTQKPAESSSSTERVLEVPNRTPSVPTTPRTPVTPKPPNNKAATPIPEPPTPSPQVPKNNQNEVEMEDSVAPPPLNLSMETQRVQREVTPEVEEEEMEQEQPSDRSIDIMEQEGEQEEEPMEQEEEEPVQVFANILAADKSKSPISASPVASATASSSNLQVGGGGNKEKDPAGALLRDVAARLEEEEEVASEHGSNRDDNFSFNFFGQKNGGSEENGSGNESEANFDFNFNGNGSGDDGGSGGAGGFDFLGVGSSDDNAGAGASDADPFGFGKSSGNGGAGDMSFNFNFDGGNGDNEGGSGGSGAGANNNFFNF